MNQKPDAIILSSTSSQALIILSFHAIEIVLGNWQEAKKLYFRIQLAATTSTIYTQKGNMRQRHTHTDTCKSNLKKKKNPYSKCSWTNK